MKEFEKIGQKYDPMTGNEKPRYGESHYTMTGQIKGMKRQITTTKNDLHTQSQPNIGIKPSSFKRDMMKSTQHGSKDNLLKKDDKKPRKIVRNFSTGHFASMYPTQNYRERAKNTNFYSYAKSKNLIEDPSSPKKEDTNADDPTQDSPSEIQNAFLKKANPAKYENRTNFQGILTTLDQRLKKSQLSHMNNRHVTSLPKLGKAQTSADVRPKERKRSSVKDFYAVSGKLGPGMNFAGKAVPEWDAEKVSNRIGTGKNSGRNSYKSDGKDSMRTLKQVHYQLG